MIAIAGEVQGVTVWLCGRGGNLLVESCRSVPRGRRRRRRRCHYMFRLCLGFPVQYDFLARRFGQGYRQQYFGTSIIAFPQLSD